MVAQAFNMGGINGAELATLFGPHFCRHIPGNAGQVALLYHIGPLYSIFVLVRAQRIIVLEELSKIVIATRGEWKLNGYLHVLDLDLGYYIFSSRSNLVIEVRFIDVGCNPVNIFDLVRIQWVLYSFCYKCSVEAKNLRLEIGWWNPHKSRESLLDALSCRHRQYTLLTSDHLFIGNLPCTHLDSFLQETELIQCGVSHASHQKHRARQIVLDLFHFI